MVWRHCVCFKRGPYFRDRVPIGTVFTFWVPTYVSESLFSLFLAKNYAMNVNIFCMCKTLGKFDLSVWVNPCTIIILWSNFICRHLLHATLLENLDLYFCLRIKFYKSLFWVPFFDCRGSLLGDDLPICWHVHMFTCSYVDQMIRWPEDRMTRLHDDHMTT